MATLLGALKKPENFCGQTATHVVAFVDFRRINGISGVRGDTGRLDLWESLQQCAGMTRMLNPQLCKTPVGVVQLFPHKSDIATKVNRRGYRNLTWFNRLALLYRRAAP